MPTRTAERQELYKVIDALPDDSVAAMLGLIKSLRPNAEAQDNDGFASPPLCEGRQNLRPGPHIPNAETMAAIEECRARRGKRASSIEEFFEAMRNAVDSSA